MQKPFPKTTHFKYIKTKRAGRVFFDIIEKYGDKRAGFFGNRMGGEWYLIPNLNRFTIGEMEEIIKICKWIQSNIENEPDTQNIIPETPA